MRKDLYEISKRLNKELTKNILIDLYINKRLSSPKIGKIFNVNHRAILKRLKKFNIPIRTISESLKGLCLKDWIKKQMSYDLLFNLYIIQRKNTVDLAKKFNTSSSVINKYLRLYNIKIRSNSESHIGLQAKEKHPNWIGGCNKYGYSSEFNNELKQKIRERDNFVCQYCGITEEENQEKYNTNLHVHHIDYNKENCNEDNLIALCYSCHTKTNYNRKNWKDIFNKKMEEIKNAVN